MQIFRSFKPVPWEETVVVSPFEREKKKKKEKKSEPDNIWPRTNRANFFKLRR